VPVRPEEDGTAGRKREIQIGQIPESPSHDPFGSHDEI
jgi:hypothetical protein